MCMIILPATPMEQTNLFEPLRPGILYVCESVSVYVMCVGVCE